MATMPDMPEHDKLAANKVKHEVIIDFIDFLEGIGCSIIADDDEHLYTDRAKAELIAEFLGVNHSAYLAEKDALLAYVRKSQV